MEATDTSFLNATEDAPSMHTTQASSEINQDAVVVPNNGESDDEDGFASAHEAQSQMSEQSVALSISSDGDRIGVTLATKGADAALSQPSLEQDDVNSQDNYDDDALQADEDDAPEVVGVSAVEEAAAVVDEQLLESRAAASAAVEEAVQGVQQAVDAVQRDIAATALAPQGGDVREGCPIDVPAMMSRAVEAAQENNTGPSPPSAPPASALISKGPPPGMGGLGLAGGIPSLPPRNARRSTPASSSATSAPPQSTSAPANQQSSAASVPASGGGGGGGTASSGMPSLPARTTPAAARGTSSPAVGPPPGSAPGGGPGGAVRSAVGVGAAAAAEPAQEEPEKVRQMRRKVQDLRVTLIRAALRLGHTPRSSIVQQVIYRLDLAERIHHPPRSAAARRVNAMDTAVAEATRMEQQEPHRELPLSVAVMCIGPVGVGKSSTINSLLGYDALPVNSMEGGGTKVGVVEGVVRGIRMKFIDTPGLRTSASQIAYNSTALTQMHNAFKRHSPDLVLYFDRLDVVRRDMCDLPLLRQITDKFGSAMWFNTLLVLTHAAATPPEGMNGPMSMDLYVNSRTHMLQNAIRQAAGDMRLLNPTSLVENDIGSCATNDDGEPLLQDGNPWKQNLQLLCLSSKLLTDTDELLDIHSTAGGSNRAMQFLRAAQTVKLPPIAYLLSSFLSSKHPRKPPEDERDIKRDDELEDLPPDQKKEEVRKKREFIRQRSEEAKVDDNGSQVSVPAPDPQLPPTFDSDTNGHRYRFLEAAGGWIARPLVEQAGLDHDDGVDGFSVERPTVLRPKHQYIGGLPFYIMSQVQKDKNQFSLTGEAEGSMYHSSRHVTTGTMEVQTIGKDMMYTSKLESRLQPTKNSKTAIGVIASRLTEGHGIPTKGPVAVGMKLEQKLKIRPNVKMTASAGTMNTKSRIGRDTAHGANAEIKMKGIVDESAQLLVGGTVMHYRKDMALGANIAGQFNVTPETQLSSRFNLNSKGTGQLVVRCSSHDYPQLGYSLLVPVVGALWNKLRGEEVY